MPSRAASSSDWSTGPGDAEVRGPAADLLLAVLGRPAGLPALTGPGAAVLAGRLAGAAVR